MDRLPVGTVTFLLTDVEGSTRLWQDDPDAMSKALAIHDDLVGRVVTKHDGALVKSRGEGDSTFSAFARPTNAVAAAVELQSCLATFAWPDDLRLAVRVALHTGEAELRDGDYFGSSVNRCARLRAIAHGGQVIASAATAALVADDLHADILLRDLGVHRLRDLERPERVFQIASAKGQREFPPLRSLDAFQNNLPSQRTSFVGRQDEIRAVHDHLRDKRLVTLTGVGGCGKTRLALHVAADEVESFPDGVYFVELAPVTDPATVASAVAAAFGLQVGGAAAGQTVQDDLAHALQDRKALLVLDNCEHLVEACGDLVDEILERCCDVKVIATSREPIEVTGEQAVLVPSLRVPDGGEGDAVRLFCDRAAAVRDGFELTDETRPAVAEICRRLDGMPLAIELAAARISHMSAQQIADRLDDRFALLTGGRRKMQRQQTLGATLDWSHELLSADERTLLRRLAVFSGSFTLDACEAICAEDLAASVVDVLRSLVAKSMVVADEGREVRYRLLETVRLYAEDKLVAAGEADTIRTRHRDHFLEWAESRPDDDFLRSDAGVITERNNLRTSLVWSERQGRIDLVGRTASTMVPVWDFLDREDGLRWMKLAMTGLGELNDHQRLRVLIARRCAAVYAFEPRGALEFLSDALDLCGDEAGFWPSVAHSLATAARAGAGWRGEDVSGAIELHGRRALDLATTPGASLLAHAWLAGSRLSVGNVQGSIESHEAALRIGLEEQLSAWASYEALNLSFLHHLLGSPDAALERAELAAELSRRGITGVWELYYNLGIPVALAGLGRHAQAMNQLRDHLEEVGSAGLYIPGTLTAVVIVLGALAAMRGDWERACILFGSGRAAMDRGLNRGPSDPALYVHHALAALEVLGDEALLLGERGAAMPLEEALAYGLDVDVPDEPAHPLTDREVEVARLVASGMTNRRIAEQLVLSTRTVDAHVDHIRNKLGVRSRAEIAAWVATTMR